MSDHQTSADLAYRMGAAAVGMFAGVALGLLAGAMSASVAPFMFGGAAAGVVTGIAFPDTAIRGAELTVHFFVGLFSGALGFALDDPTKVAAPKESKGHRWLFAAFTFGVVFSVVLALLLRL